MGQANWADYLAWADPALVPLFSLLQAPVTPLELLAFILSLWMVACNLRVNVWGWPLAIISSLLYGVFFARGRLYGEASLQLVFVAVSIWGWWQWLRPSQEARPLESSDVHYMSKLQRLQMMALTLIAWPVMGLVLRRFTDTDVPFLDAFPTTLSLLGQYLLGRKAVENWPVWLVVNVASMGLFVYKGFWLTVVLYAVFAVLSVVGWRQWRNLTASRS
ncbi:MAG: nicotinamide riboside transporter PnuC [Burkholderiales bacterium]|nr:nicotinamide riboside transporter PnuC [Burkholderiales bacterium]